MNKTPPIAVTIAVWLLFVVAVPPARAHVEQNMPPGMAVMEYRILLEFTPDDYKTRLKFAAALEALKRYDEAEKEIKKVLTAKKNDFNAIDLLGLVRLRQGTVAEGIKLFNRAIAINPLDTMVFYHLGLALAESGEREEGIQALKQALKNNGDSGKGWKKRKKTIIKTLNRLKEENSAKEKGKKP